MLQKIENSFLSILRAVVLAAAALSLIGFVIFGVGALKLAKSEPEPQAPSIHIAPQSLLDQVTDKQSTPASAPVAASAATTAQDSKRQEVYDRACKAIAKFAVAMEGPQTTINRDKVISVIDERAKLITGENLKKDYIAGMGVALEKVLGDPNLVKQAKQQQNPYAVIDRTLDAYTEQFNRQVEANDASNALAKQQYFENKAEGMQNLYYAVGLFGAFLLIVFLSIFIKIERNLRYLAFLRSDAATSATPPAQTEE